MENKSEEFVDNDVIEIIPVEEYDSLKAKLHASLAWVLGKAYKDKVPSEFHDPLYRNNAGEWHVKPRLMNLLTTSELYCQACSNMFGDSSSQWQGHWSIIQVLSRKGIYVMGTNDEDITETVLMHTAPFKVHAHLALIDALMQAYAKEVVTVERVVKAVRRFSVFNASTDLPDDLEDTVLLWINKVCAHLQHKLDKKEEQILEGETTQKVKIVSKSSPKDSIIVPVMENFLSDVGDGCSLAVLVSFYCPQLRRLEDICLKASVGIADSLYNLRLVKTFCDKHIPSKIFHLTYEDLLYTHENLKMNILVMVTELFYWFEIKRAPFVTGGMFTSTEESSSVSKSAKFAVPNIPISNATKQSFQKLRAEDLRSSSTPDIHRAGSTGPVPPPQRHVLLQKRQLHLAAQHHLETDNLQHQESSRGVRRANSLSSHDRSAVKQSVIAWPEIPKEQNGLLDTTSLSKGSNLLANVSIDSELNESFSSESIDLGEFEISPRTDSARTYSISEHLCPPDIRDSSQPDYLEVESVNSGVPSRTSSVEQSKSKGDNIEPLLPARIKPAKEKTNSHTKEEERGDDESKRSPKILKPGVETFSDEIKSESSGSNFDDDRITPLPEDQLTARSEYLILPVQGQVTPATQQRKGFDAFIITGSIGDSQIIESHRSDVSRETGHSYTVADHIYTPETARAAGIPVVSDDSDIKASREGSVSSRSSGDFSDHESRKIHKDHKTRESDEMKRHCDTILSKVQVTAAPEAYISQKPVMVCDQPTKILDNPEKAKNTTSFAQMKRLKENLGTFDNSGFVYMQHGTEGLRSPLKETCPKKAEKRTTFAPLPNQTTWQENAQTSSSSPEDACQNLENGGGDVTQPVPAELLKIRLKLEEKRKSIEKKKRQAEIQQQKMRQRMGKAAFLHVVAKPKEKSMEEDGSEESNESSLSRSDLSTSTGQGTTSQLSFREKSNEKQIEASTNSSKSTQEDEFETPPQSPTRQAKSSRAFSREDIQQTIENVRKKWFKDDEDAGPKAVASDQSESSGMSSSQSSVEKDMSRSGTEKGDNYDEYSSSLDRLNRSLTDLQGEIMKLSLKKEKIQSSTSDISTGAKSKVSSPKVSPPRSESVEPSTRSRSGSRSPTKALEATKKTLPTAPENFSQGSEREYLGYPAHTDAGQFPDRPYVQSQGHVIPPVMSHVRMISQPQANTMTHPPTYPHDFQPYALQSPSHITGPVYPNPNQYGHVAPNLGMQPGGHYGGYIMGPGAQQHIGIPSYQHSPSHMYPNGPSQMFPHGYSPHTMHLTSPPNQPYPHSMYGSPSQPVPPYQPSLHSDVLHTVSSHPQHSMMPSSHVAESAVPYSGNGFQPRPELVQTTQESSSSVETAMQILNQDSQPKTRPIEKEVEDLQYTQDQASYDSSGSERLGDSSVPIDSEQLSLAKPDGGGFFVSFGEDSPRRQKPKMKAHKEKTSVPEQKVVAPQPDDKPFETELNKSGSQQDDSVLSEQHTPGVGFMIGQEESPIVKDDLDMQRKKEKLVQMQQRRREEQERKRMEKEAELARKREEERFKQDEAERRKGEEKARREIIFQQYLQRKENEDDGYLKKPDKSSRQKMRPKSMYTKALDGPERISNETYDASMSTKAPPRKSRLTPASSAGKMRKAVRPGVNDTEVSCNILSTPPGPEDLEQGLAFGGLTHRRPPSPDLDRLRLGNKGSNDSSEAGSTSGSDYTGPKLFVKPSSKSNRHIIINALSHCCLAGSVNTELKNKVLEELAKSDAKHFIILFRDAGCQYRGLYAYNPEVDEISKIHGVGPKHFNNKMIEKYFKYNSGSKSFSCVTSTKHLSVSIDAIVLHNAVWKQFSKQPVKK